MAKSKKRQRHRDASSPVVLDGSTFPAEITVELWHKPAKGKRALVGCRRYALAAELPGSTPAADAAEVKKSASATRGAKASATVARPAQAMKRPAPAKKPLARRAPRKASPS